MKDFTKVKLSGKPAVRQIRGPGMNLGLKKRPRSKKPPEFRDYNKPRSKKKAPKRSGSLIPKGFF